MKLRLKAFTLIELLIVVAIIAILAAIAVPNFLEAQVRSKVSRTKADMRTIATAVEAYTVDNNAVPTFEVVTTPSSTITYFAMSKSLSTPISYISSMGILADPFRKGSTYDDGDYPPEAPDFLRTPYFYFPWQFTDEILYGNSASGLPPSWLSLQGFLRNPSSGFYTSSYTRRVPISGFWELASIGPSGTLFVRQVPSGWYMLPYDPTNGTVSNGGIIRNQVSPEGRSNAEDYPF